VHKRILVLLSVLVTTVGCGSSTPSNPGGPTSSATPTATPTAAPTQAPLTPASAAGLWTLISINGASLPAVQGQLGSIKTEIVSDALTLTANGTFTENAQVRLTTGSNVQTDSASETGTFTIDGSTINFVGASGTRRTATVSGSTMTITVEGNAWVLRKG
jgi:hypothetical protein